MSNRNDTKQIKKIPKRKILNNIFCSRGVGSNLIFYSRSYRNSFSLKREEKSKEKADCTKGNQKNKNPFPYRRIIENRYLDSTGSIDKNSKKSKKNNDQEKLCIFEKMSIIFISDPHKIFCRFTE